MGLLEAIFKAVLKSASGTARAQQSRARSTKELAQQDGRLPAFRTPRPKQWTDKSGGAFAIGLHESYEQWIGGESHYQDEINKIVPHRRGGVVHHCTAILTPEPDNPHDPLAIAVLIDGIKVGYLGRSDAGIYSRALTRAGAQGAAVACPALINGGWTDGRRTLGFGEFGVSLAVARPFKFTKRAAT